MAPSRRRASSRASSAAAAAVARKNWKVGDLVLAKVKGFPAWPATVSEPEKWGYSADLKKVLVYFFGTKQIAFCNPADVEAFTEDRKKSLLSKRHGKGADFVRALQEIVDCFEKSKELKIDGDLNSGDEGTVSKNVTLEDPMGEIKSQIQPQSSMDIANSRLESLYISADSNGTHHDTDAQAEMRNGLHDMDKVSEEKVENASSLDLLTKKTSVAAYSRKRLIDAPVQSCVIQKRTSARRSRSTVKFEAYKLQNQLIPEIDGSANTGDVLPNGTRNESAKRSTRVRKSPGTSVWHHMESPGYSASIAVNVSSEDDGSELGATNSDTVSLNGGETLEFSCKNDPGLGVEVMDHDVQMSDRFHLPAETFVFKKKRKPNRKRAVHGTTTLSVSPNRSPSLEIQVEKTTPYSPNSCANLPDRFSRTNGDEHLPLLKRAWVRTGKPLLEKQLNELVGTEEESFKEVSVSNSEPMLSSSSYGNGFHDINGISTTNSEPRSEIKPTVINSKFQLSGSVDAEPPLEKKQLNESSCAEEESSKEVSVNNSEPLLSSSSCGNYFQDGNGLPTTNGPPCTEKEPTLIPSKFHLCGLVDGEPLLEEKQLNELVGTEEESSKAVLINNSEPLFSSLNCGSFSYGNDFREVNGIPSANGQPRAEKEPTWVASKFKLRGSEYGEAALPPSKRLHRALEAMSANAAEEIQTFVDARVTTNPTSFNDCSDLSDKTSSPVSVDNEVGSASAAQKVNSVRGNVNGESEMMPSWTSPASELMEKPSSERKSSDSVESPNTSQSDECNEIVVMFKNPVEVEHVDDSSIDSHSCKTKTSIESPHPSSSFEHKQAALGSRIEPMVVSSPLLKSEQLQIMGSSNGISNDIPKLERAYSPEAKLAQEQGAALPNRRAHDSSEVNEAGVCSPSGEGAQLSVVDQDSYKNMQSLSTPLNKNATSMYEAVKESKYIPAEKDTDVNSLKVLIAAAQAKRQLSLSTSLSDNVPDDMAVCNSFSSPSSVRRVGSDEHVSPSSMIYHLSTGDHKNRLLHNGNVDVLQSKKSARLLEKEVGNKDSPFSHRQKSLVTRTAEANAVRKSFESMLGSLTRTKECIGRATRLAIDSAKHGIAGEVLEILVRNLETESSMHKRVDLFFLVDSITQCSRGQKGDIGDIFPSAVQAMLPRLLSAAAPPGNAARENRRQCLKVLRLWLERKTLPESIIRHHMRELDSVDVSYTTVHSRRPLRMERALNDPIREMEGMQVDEYGSNASIQLPGFCMPCMVEEEGSDAEERSFEAVTPEPDPEICVERDATPTSTFERHCHILEDVDGELEMEDVAPSYESEQCSANGVTAVDNLHHQFEQHHPMAFAPPLPADCPPSPPPLPASPPPVVPPLPSQSLISPFTDNTDLKFHPNTHNIQNLSHQHMSQRQDITSLSSVTSDTGHYCAPGYRNWGKQPLRPGSFNSTNSCRSTAASQPSVHVETNAQQIDGGSLHNNSYHLQPPPPTHSNQFSYVHTHQRRQSWMDASSSSFNKRFRVGLDMHREDILDNREKMELTPRDIRERRRLAAPIHSVRVQSDNPEASYRPVHYGPPQESTQESTRILNRGWSFPPRALNYQNPTPCIPPEAPTFWRPR